MHTVLYDDGDEEELALAFEHWVFADGRQQGQPAQQPLALMGSRDLGPAQEGQPAKKARTGEAAGGAGGADELQAALLAQAPGGAALQPLLPGLERRMSSGSGDQLPFAAPPASRAATPQLPGAFPLYPLATPPPAPPPPKLVASGRNYRAFTSSSLPAGFELFMLLPGMSIDEASSLEVAGLLIGRGLDTDGGNRRAHALLTSSGQTAPCRQTSSRCLARPPCLLGCAKHTAKQTCHPSRAGQRALLEQRPRAGKGGAPAAAATQRCSWAGRRPCRIRRARRRWSWRRGAANPGWVDRCAISPHRCWAQPRVCADPAALAGGHRQRPGAVHRCGTTGEHRGGHVLPRRACVLQQEIKVCWYLGKSSSCSGGLCAYQSSPLAAMMPKTLQYVRINIQE